MYSPRAQALLHSARHGVPRPTKKWPMDPNGDQNHACLWKHTPPGQWANQPTHTASSGASSVGGNKARPTPPHPARWPK